jgi:hypothetical protein
VVRHGRVVCPPAPSGAEQGEEPAAVLHPCCVQEWSSGCAAPAGAPAAAAVMGVWRGGTRLLAPAPRASAAGGGPARLLLPGGLCGACWCATAVPSDAAEGAVEGGLPHQSMGSCCGCIGAIWAGTCPTDGLPMQWCPCTAEPWWHHMVSPCAVICSLADGLELQVPCASAGVGAAPSASGFAAAATAAAGFCWVGEGGGCNPSWCLWLQTYKVGTLSLSATHTALPTLQ